MIDLFTQVSGELGPAHYFLLSAPETPSSCP